MAGFPLYGAGVSKPTLAAKPLLVADGWRKRAGDLYSRPLAGGVFGVLSLGPNRGLPYQWSLQPYVGVVHERVNAVAMALTGVDRKRNACLATIRYQLVRLLDGPEAHECGRWTVATAAPDGNERVFREVTEAARAVGLPWMQKRTSLDAVIYELRDGNGPWRRTPYLATALWMKGEVAAAESWLDQVASQFGAPPPQVPQPLRDRRVTAFGTSAPPEGWPRDQFDAFAGQLRGAMAQYPDGPPEDWLPQPR